jgi:glyoxylase-like metal-dependent hydrolase (beta-lactamase superfamily II)
MWNDHKMSVNASNPAQLPNSRAAGRKYTRADTGALYDGRRPPGEKSIRELPGLQVSKISVGPMDNNCYLLTDSATGSQILVDAAAQPDRLLSEITPGRLETVVTTHQHPDHWHALWEVLAATEALSLAHPLDATSIRTASGTALISETLSQGDSLTFGETHLDVIHLQGHTPGGLALVYREPEGRAHIFTGDSLFPGGIGKTWTPTGFDELYADVTAKIFANYSDDTWIHPGHGFDTTLGAERPHLEEWAERRW